MSKRFRGNVFTLILDILSKLLMYIYNWWDGWPPHSRCKRLSMGRKYSLAHWEAPK
jgi:hypothetical protein